MCLKIVVLLCFWTTNCSIFSKFFILPYWRFTTSAIKYKCE